MEFNHSNQFEKAQQEWLEELDSFEAELNRLDAWLDEITVKNKGREFFSIANHFHDQFIINQNRVEELRKNITQVNNRVYIDERNKLPGIKLVRPEDQQYIEGELLKLENLINDLRHEFSRYATKWD